MEESIQELPKYQCHKIVHALKIKHVYPSTDPSTGKRSVRITPEEEGYATFNVSPEYFEKHDPQPGGYFVVYGNGYQSFSPADAFESGYTLIV